MRICPAIVALSVLGLLAPVAAHADQFGPEPPASLTHFTFDAGVTGGGDKLVQVDFSDGSSQSLYAGDSGYLDVGVLQDFGDPHWSLKGTLGYAYAAVNGSNATISFSHVPLEVTGLYNLGNNHFGFGLRYDMNPRLDLDGLGPNGNFNNALGWILEYRWWLFGVRYTNIMYRSPQGDASGNSLGLFFNYAF
ncbi:MAG TPA: hypothetical protein VJR90_02785 [Gammaproteobacteria bacterium]|nr:hypothetical protein [Gammaproteobacteria bacterium]